MERLAGGRGAIEVRVSVVGRREAVVAGRQRTRRRRLGAHADRLGRLGLPEHSSFVKNLNVTVPPIVKLLLVEETVASSWNEEPSGLVSPVTTASRHE